MYRSLKHDKDFEVSLSYDLSDGLLPPGISSHIFALYSVTGLKDAADKYALKYDFFLVNFFKERKGLYYHFFELNSKSTRNLVICTFDFTLILRARCFL